MHLRKRTFLFYLLGLTLFFLISVFAFRDRLESIFRPEEQNCTRHVIRSTIGDMFLSADHHIPEDLWSIRRQKRFAAFIDHIRLALDSLRLETLRANISRTHSELKHTLFLLEEDLGVRKFRSSLSRNLSRDIQSKIHLLQEPEDCAKARKLECNLNNGNGLASGVHDILWCSVEAFFSQRMLVVKSSEWHYTPNGWESYFRPLSQKCGPSHPESENVTFGPGPNDGVHRRLIVKLPLDLCDQLIMLGDNPLPWWYGQFLGYVLRPNAAMEALIDSTQHYLDFKSPIVGLHIRRSDKIGTEAVLHHVHEYMREVEHYFEVLALQGSSTKEKRVFLASDDSAVFQECHERYPTYKFLQVPNTSALAGNLKTRYEEDAVEGALLDLFLLSRTDFIVCTFSSGFCRLAYELMQYNRPNALGDAFSLDTEYFYAYVANPSQEVLRDSPPGDGPWSKEIYLRRGDLLLQPDLFSLQIDAIRGKTHDGLTRGRNQRTKEEGLYHVLFAAPFFEVANYTDN